jgi:hypothetical protein
MHHFSARSPCHQRLIEPCSPNSHLRRPAAQSVFHTSSPVHDHGIREKKILPQWISMQPTLILNPR